MANLTNQSVFENATLYGDEDCVIRQDGQTEQDFFHFLLYGILLNSVGILGLIGNIVSIAILTRPNMRSSINCCLVGLATFDTILLTTSLLMFGLSAIPEYTGAIMWYQKDIFPWITLAAYPLGLAAQTGSVYLTVTVTVERYVAVCHPLRARSLCTFGRAKLYVIAVAIFAVSYNMPRFWELTYKFCDDDENGFTTVVMTAVRQSDSYIQIYITWLYLVVMYLVPFLSLLVFNIFIYKQVRIANQERQRLSRLQKKELGLAVMLLCVVIVFFFCNILAFIVNVLEMFGIAISYLTMISNLLVTVNSSVNFVIYCIFGQKFRRLFLQIFCFGPHESYMGVDGPLLESGVAGNSLYGEHRPLSNGGSANSRRLHISNWGASHSNRVLGPGARRSWSNSQGTVMSVIGSHNKQYRNVSLRDLPEQNGGSKLRAMSGIGANKMVPPSSSRLQEEAEEKSDYV